MDELKIESKFMRWMVSKFISSWVKNKLGYDVKVSLNAFKATHDVDGQVHIHLDVDGDVDEQQFKKITRIMKEGN